MGESQSVLSALKNMGVYTGCFLKNFLIFFPRREIIIKNKGGRRIAKAIKVYHLIKTASLKKGSRFYLYSSQPRLWQFLKQGIDPFKQPLKDHVPFAGAQGPPGPSIHNAV
jgi:hypothetical protein